MDKGRILAHRGFWTRPEEKNSPEALKRALGCGYGIETDVRDLDGKLVISHDPPRNGAPSFDWLLDEYVAIGSQAVLAINIKSDGLAGDIRTKLKERSIETAFFFDMSIPDTLGYLSAGLPVYSRVSEYEAAPAFETPGIWLDNFSGGFPQVKRASEFVAGNKSVAFVSPELHKRAHHEFWDELSIFVRANSESVLICTDFPDQAEALFCGNDAK